jgi:hypothetical protein
LTEVKNVRLTKEFVFSLASQFNTPTEFAKAHPGAYNKAGTSGWRDELNKTVFIESFESSMTVEKVKESAKKCKTLTEFRNNFPREATWVRANKCIDVVGPHLARRKMTNWTLTSVKKIAKKFKTRIDFQRSEPKAYNASTYNGWHDIVCAHMSPMQECWTYKKILTIALRYETRSAFYYGDSCAYDVAHNRGWLDEVCAHMKSGTNGFDRNKRGVLYQFCVFHGRKIYYKIGISNHTPEIRSRTFGLKEGVSVKLMKEIWYDYGGDCKAAEKALKDDAKAAGFRYPKGRELMKNGFTEIFTQPLLR